MDLGILLSPIILNNGRHVSSERNERNATNVTHAVIALCVFGLNDYPNAQDTGVYFE